MKGGTRRQAFASLVATVNQFTVGFNLALHSVTIIQIPAEEDRFVSDAQLSWSIALTALAAAGGCMILSPVATPLGARRLLMLLQPLNMLAALAAGLGRHFGWLMLGRLLMFSTLGVGESTARAYVSEVVAPSRRTVCMALMNMGTFVSQVVGLLVAPQLGWRALFLVAGFLPGSLLFAGFWFLPDSPKWLLARGREEAEARRAALFFHDRPEEVDAEIAAIRDSLKHSAADAAAEAATEPVWKLLLTRRESLRPLLLAAGSLVLFVWAGGTGVTFLGSFILGQVDLPLDTYQLSALPIAVGVVFALPMSIIIERTGRLPLLRLSGAVSALGCAGIAAYFFMPQTLRAAGGGWAALAGAALCQFSFACVSGPIAQVHMNELLPTRTRVMAASVLMGWLQVHFFLFLKLLPPLTGWIGFGGAFCLQAAVSVAQFLYAAFCLPETGGLSLEEIQQIFQKRTDESRTKEDESQTKADESQTKEDEAQTKADEAQTKVEAGLAAGGDLQLNMPTP